MQALPDAADRFFACDTEVVDIDVKRHSPVGHGRVICASIFCGPDVDFGSGSRVWIDNHGEAEGVLMEFKAFFENPLLKKVWHNYSFDRHVLFNHGIDARGFAGDTMHMARLWDTSRAREGVGGGGEGYSLEALSASDELYRGVPGLLRRASAGGATTSLVAVAFAATITAGTRIKRTMKDIFGQKHIKKDGTEGKLTVVPEVIELHTDPELREAFIRYSADDAEVTWRLREALAWQLRQRAWRRQVGSPEEWVEWMETSEWIEMAEHMPRCSKGMMTMYDFYWMYMLPFGECLTDMERNGIYVDTKERLPRAELRAVSDKEALEAQFMAWATHFCPEAAMMNVSSDAQKQQLLFGAWQEKHPNLLKPLAVEGGAASRARMPRPLPLRREFSAENTAGVVEEGKTKPKKKVSFTISGVGLPPVELAQSGMPSVSAAALRKLAGTHLDTDQPKWGEAYFACGGRAGSGEETCRAIDALLRAGSIDTMLSNFILPLQQQVDARGRIHCSLNLNTETGRLSSRRPNLQNQPALEKDVYRIRDAFTCEPGNALVVADYGQLELRLLAHMANCKSMIQAFEAGGDFHSRTAMGMFSYIAEACDKGEVLLEWDKSQGKAPRPLIKDVYAAERRKAKVLNFSIAYGKTPVGLAKDFGVTEKEAKETLELWYKDRPEVREWQERVISVARKHQYTRTLMGRFRDLPFITDRRMRGHGQRAAINTPVQGGAADVVMMAMLKIHYNQRLRDMGWKLLLQIHDEVILEGPKESQSEAKALVVSLMECPFAKPLRVDLVVDAKCASTWYEAK